MDSSLPNTPAPATAIVACVDREAEMPSVCDHAVWAARGLGGALEFLHVIDSHSERTPAVDMSGSIGLGARETLLAELSELDAKRGKIAQERGRLLVEAAARRAEEAGTAHGALRPRARRTSGRQLRGTFVETLAELEATTRLFVIGQHHHDGELSKRHLDHNLERAVRVLRRPLLVAAPTFSAPTSYLLAFDGSAATRQIVERVASSPLFRGLRGHVVTAGRDSSERRAELRWAAERIGESDDAPETAIVDGHPERVLGDYAARRGIELLVMGAYGHSRIRHLIVGSTTTAVLRESPIAVLVLR